MKKKVTYIISDINRALAFEWIAAYMDAAKFELTFILLNKESSVLEVHLRDKKIQVIRIAHYGKSSWFSSFIKLYSYFKKYKPDIIHCHLKDATTLGLLAGKIAGINSRIHTRHHSSLHHIYFSKGVFWDKLNNRLSTHIIAISGEVKKILIEWENTPREKVYYIPHGFLLNEFSEINPASGEHIKHAHKIKNTHPIIGVISRFTHWKGVQYIIPAFKEVLAKYPDAQLLLFNANGDYEKEIRTLLCSLHEDRYKTIAFEPDIVSAYHLMDICVHVPIDEHSEAFGQIYIEALAAGVPLVATLSGIANDILVHKSNSWVVPHQNSDAIKEGIITILENNMLKNELIKNGKETVKSFSLQNMIKQLSHLYENA